MPDENSTTVMNARNSKEDIEAIAGTLRRSYGRVIAHERRRSPRIPGSGEIRLIPVECASETSELTLMLEDLSACGLGLSHWRALPPGSRFIVTFGEHPQNALDVVSEVVRCARLSDGLYGVAVQFLSVLSTLRAT